MGGWPHRSAPSRGDSEEQDSGADERKDGEGDDQPELEPMDGAHMAQQVKLQGELLGFFRRDFEVLAAFHQQLFVILEYESSPDGQRANRLAKPVGLVPVYFTVLKDGLLQCVEFPDQVIC